MISVFTEKRTKSIMSESTFSCASYAGKLVCITRKLFRFHQGMSDGHVLTSAAGVGANVWVKEGIVSKVTDRRMIIHLIFIVSELMLIMKLRLFHGMGTDPDHSPYERPFRAMPCMVQSTVSALNVL